MKASLKEANSSSCSSSSSTSSNPSAAAVVAAPALQKKTLQRGSQNKTWQDESELFVLTLPELGQTTQLKRNASQRQRLAAAAAKCGKNWNPPLNAILEDVDQLHASHVLASTGCIETLFTSECVDDSNEARGCRACPEHGIDYKPHCQQCTNHQFMVHKHMHEVAEQKAIEASFNCFVEDPEHQVEEAAPEPKAIGDEGNLSNMQLPKNELHVTQVIFERTNDGQKAACRTHGLDFREDCSICNYIVRQMDALADAQA